MEINWWQVIATILGSGVISALLTGLWLNVRTEKIKAELQRSLYEFQTKFSWFHQKRAETIHDFFTIFLEIQYKVEHFYYGNQSNEELNKLKGDFSDFITFYIKSSLYFEDELNQKIEKIRDSMSDMIDKYIDAVYSKEDRNRVVNAGNRMIDAHKQFRQQTFEDRNIIKNEFRKLLTEFPNNQLEKKI